MSERKGDWLQTFTGKKFWPKDPRPEEICIEDIAHALSLMCRYGGHCREFFSVAQHSVHVASQVPEEDQLWALLHDASEAYLVDIPRPIKYDSDFSNYLTWERRLMLAVCERFGLPTVCPSSVIEADDRMLATERKQIMSGQLFWKSCDLESYPIVITPWGPADSERVFLSAFDSVGGKR